MHFLRILPIVIAVALRADGNSQQPAKTVDPVEIVISEYENDRRIPRLENISGAWSPNPIEMGALTYFTLTESKGVITGMAFTRGCMMTGSSIVTGSRAGSALTLKLTSKIGDEDYSFTQEFTILTYMGVPALARKGGSDKFPMVPRLNAKSLEPAIRQELLESQKK